MSCTSSLSCILGSLARWLLCQRQLGTAGILPVQLLSAVLHCSLYPDCYLFYKRPKQMQHKCRFLQRFILPWKNSEATKSLVLDASIYFQIVYIADISVYNKILMKPGIAKNTFEIFQLFIHFESHTELRSLDLKLYLSLHKSGLTDLFTFLSDVHWCNIQYVIGGV